MERKCMACGNSIHPDRLVVLPATDLCIVCAQAGAKPAPVKYRFTAEVIPDLPEGPEIFPHHLVREYNTIRGQTGASRGFWSEEYSPLNAAGREAREQEFDTRMRETAPTGG